MPCYFPQKAWYSKIVNESGKRSLTFQRANAQFADLPIEIPCGICMGCRLEKSAQWAMRITHEQQLHQENCFLTLTYNPESLPHLGSLQKEDVQLFMKRLRKNYPDKKIRFYACGEYGEQTNRPHYHLILFGVDPTDKQLYSVKNGNNIYISPTFTRLWPHGDHKIGSVTFESAGYVARYTTKKIYGEKAESYYRAFNYATGDYEPITPEFALMSLRPGIGSDWYDKYKQDLINTGFCIVNGQKATIPMYYQKKLELDYPEAYQKYKQDLQLAAALNKEDNTLSRLDVKLECREAKLLNLTREFEKNG